MEEEDKIVKRPSTFPVFSKNLAVILFLIQLQPITVVDFAN